MVSPLFRLIFQLALTQGKEAFLGLGRSLSSQHGTQTYQISKTIFKMLDIPFYYYSANENRSQVIYTKDCTISF